MTRAFAVGLGIVLSLGIGTAQAQPKKQKTPAPKKAPPAPEPPKPEPPKPQAPQPGDPKADTNATLKNSGDLRPWAINVSQPNQEAATAKFREGNVSLNDGLFINAVDAYRDALKLWDHPAIHYNLALALLKLDRPLELYDALQAALKYGEQPFDERDKYEHAKEYLALVEKLIAEVDVSCDKLGAKVSVDGKEVFTVTKEGPNRYTGRVKIGKHTFVAQRTGYNAQIDAPNIEPGQKFAIELKLYTSEELTRYKRKWKAEWIPYAVIGGGVLVGGIAGLMQLSANSSFKEFDTKIAKCNEDTGMNGGCDVNSGGLQDLKSSGNTKRTLGYIGYGLAGATAAVGIALIYFNRETAYQITADEYRQEQNAHAVSVTPIVAPGMAGAQLQGRF